jgi:hypothetical protein
VLRYLRAMNRHHDEAWAFSTSRSSAKQKFQLKAGKRRALDRFFSGVKRRLASAVGRDLASTAEVVWGSAKFSPSGKGNLSVPTSSMFQVACRHFAGRVHLGDEFATSQTCPECFSQLVGARVAAPEGVALRHLKSVDEDGTPRTLAWKIRHGFVYCAGHKRLLRRPSAAKATTTLRLVHGLMWRDGAPVKITIQVTHDRPRFEYEWSQLVITGLTYDLARVDMSEEMVDRLVRAVAHHMATAPGMPDAVAAVARARAACQGSSGG